MVLVGDKSGNRHELSWHKSREKAIAVATAHHQETGLPYWIDLEVVLISRQGVLTAASYPDQWSIEG